MSANNAQLFKEVLESMYINTPLNVTMICWRDTSDTVMVSIVDMGTSGIPPGFESELREKLKYIPSLSHISVNTISFFDINSIKGAHVATEQARAPDMCFYVNGNVTINTINHVF
jgi:hypothetical protein